MYKHENFDENMLTEILNLDFYRYILSEAYHKIEQLDLMTHSPYGEQNLGLSKTNHPFHFLIFFQVIFALQDHDISHQQIQMKHQHLQCGEFHLYVNRCASL